MAYLPAEFDGTLPENAPAGTSAYPPGVAVPAATYSSAALNNRVRMLWSRVSRTGDLSAARAALRACEAMPPGPERHQAEPQIRAMLAAAEARAKAASAPKRKVPIGHRNPTPKSAKRAKAAE